MSADVFILATCRNPELLSATTLVFETLRVGFPTANIRVYHNEPVMLGSRCAAAIQNAARGANCCFSKTRTTHHEWVAALIDTEAEPFWILDTDVIFYGDLEHFGPRFSAPLAGRYIPGFQCEFTKAWTMPRLHTSLLYIDPVRLRREMENFYEGFIPPYYFTPRPNLVYPQFVMEKVGLLDPERPKWTVKTTFYDTCSLLYNSVQSQSFCEDQLDAYSHLNCGTIADIVAPSILDGKMVERHKQIIANPELARGLWRADLEYYESRQQQAP